MKIMIFETEKEALEAEREISRVLGYPCARWTGRGEGKKRHAIPVQRSDNKWIFPAPSQGWCGCTEDFCCSQPEYPVCREATFSVTVNFTVEEIELVEFSELLEVAFPDGYEKLICYEQKG